MSIELVSKGAYRAHTTQRALHRGVRGPASGRARICRTRRLRIRTRSAVILSL